MSTMKPAKPAAVDAPSHRRSQPSRQARTNPTRSSANAGRSGDSRNAANGRPSSNRPVDIFPAITHFADTMSALPKELVRHFTLLKEVDAKIFAPEEQLFKLVAATTESSATEPRATWDASSTAPSGSAPMSAQNSPSGMALNRAPPSSAPSISSATAAPTSVFDPSNIPRRQIFRRTAFKIQEMLVSLEEKNHVLSTANEALQRQLARVEDVWPHLENEFSDEAKWGSTTHWAYPENRAGGKVSQTERIRRDGAAAISAAAQALAEEAAARSDARKQAVQAKKNLKNQHQDSDADDVEKRQKEAPKKTAKSRKTAAIEANSVGLGISASTTNGNHPPKRRKVEKTANGEKATNAAAAAAAATTTAATSTTAVPAASSANTSTSTTNTTYNAGGNGIDAGVAAAFMSMVFGNNTPKAKTSSPRGTPAPDGQKKRKALPTGSVQAKKKNGMSPSTTSSPVMGPFPDPKVPSRASPAPSSAPRPASSRARQNSIQSNVENGKARPSSSAAANKTNGNGANTPEPASTATLPKPGQDSKPTKEASAPIKTELIKKETEKPESASTATATSTSSIHKKDGKPEEADQKSESVPAPVPPPVTTKSGRASKPSTPALATFQEAAAASRSRPSRAEGTNSRKSHKKSGSVAQQPLIQQVQAADTDASSSMQGDDEEGDIDADEPTYCYCNSVSYGEMVACDADGCEREWFHLACVGLKVAPGSKTKWYCEDCKDRLKIGNKKAGR